MTRSDIKKLCVSLYNMTFVDFCRDFYGEELNEKEESYGIKDSRLQYLDEKWVTFNVDPLKVVASLDTVNLKLLAERVSKQEPGEDAETEARGTIVVEVRGGIVQHVSGIPKGILVMVKDYDNPSEETWEGSEE